VLGKVNSNTISRYTFTDANAFANSALVYYRIKQTDKDGKSDYTQIVSVRNETKATSAASFYPNPVQDNLHADFSTELADATIEVLDSYGKPVFTQSHVNGFGSRIDVSALPAGVYIFKATQGGEALHVSKFVKN
jgi:hypothetical protein